MAELDTNVTNTATEEQTQETSVNPENAAAAETPAAKSKGVKFGHPRKPLPENFDDLYHRYLRNEPIYRLAKECQDISESTCGCTFMRDRKQIRPRVINLSSSCFKINKEELL